MGLKVQLTIPRSTSSNLRTALGIARKFSQFSENEEKKLCFLIIYGSELRTSYRAFESLFELVQNWKGTKLEINGQLADFKLFRYLISVFECAERRSKSVFPNEYCDEGGGGWGCRFINTIKRSLPTSIYEYNYGYNNHYGSVPFFL